LFGGGVGSVRRLVRELQLLCLVDERQLEPHTTSMVIVVHMGSDIKAYLQRYLPLIQGEGGEELIVRTCPSCGREGMHRHEYKSRQVILPDEQEGEQIEVLRMRCPGCGSTHTLLPHFVIPYHTYGARTIMKALRLYAEHGSYRLVRHLIDCVRNRAVVRQWVQRFSEVLPQLTMGLQRFLLQVGSVVPSRWRQRSTKDPPLRGVLQGFIRAVDHAAGFLSEHVRRAHLPEGDGDLLGWTHLVLQRTDHLIV